MAVQRRTLLNFSSFVCLVCALTNLSQMTYLVEGGITRYLAIPVWIVFAIICLLRKPDVNLYRSKNFLITSILFAVYYFILLVFNETYAQSRLPYSIFLSVFIFLVGIAAGSILTREDIEKICTTYVLSGMIVAIDVYVNCLSA